MHLRKTKSFFYLRVSLRSSKKKVGWQCWKTQCTAIHFVHFACKKFPEEPSEVKPLSRVRLFVTPWTVACQISPSMEFPRQEYWSGLPFPSPGDLPSPRIEPVSPALQADSLTSELSENPSRNWGISANSRLLWALQIRNLYFNLPSSTH